jgi:hypothetical protein
MNLPTFNRLFGFGLAFLDFVSDFGKIMDSFVLELSVLAGMNEFFAFDTSTVGVLDLHLQPCHQSRCQLRRFRYPTKYGHLESRGLHHYHRQTPPLLQFDTDFDSEIDISQ